MNDGESTSANGAILDLLGIAEDPLGTADPISLMRALGAATAGTLRHPARTSAAYARWLVGSAGATGAAFARAVGKGSATQPALGTSDRRFADRAFEENPIYFLLAEQYLLYDQLVTELLDAAALQGVTDAKARFAAKLLIDAMAPTNTVPGNPAAVRRAFDTGGKSVARGFGNWLHDLRHNGGWPSQVDASPFELGRNLAATPGSVVYRSELIELIQYAPQTEQVHAVPLVFCPPWINKYYILDLAPGKSLIEWAVQHGHTCFAISYRNPEASMAGLDFEDYLRQGPLDAIRVAREITAASQVNTVSLCLGGTLTAIALAYKAAVGDDSVRSATFLNTHTDFTEPGMLGAFTDEATIVALERRMAKRGYLESVDMARTFNLMRANDLVFSYVVKNWLMGEQPPSFDLLAWNSDGTRMPATMHARYLRSCYLNNEFAQGMFEVDGRKLDPGAVEVDSYVLSAVDDHIVPWTSGYQTTQLFGGNRRFVLSTSGHIAGVVNPPSPKAKHWTNEELPTDPHAWKAAAELHDHTWWEDWTSWIATRGGDQVDAPVELGSELHPPREDAPGSYVRARA
jgi:polyhydroxyalkanoate synthase